MEAKTLVSVSIPVMGHVSTRNLAIAVSLILFVVITAHAVFYPATAVQIVSLLGVLATCGGGLAISGAVLAGFLMPVVLTVMAIGAVVYRPKA